MCLSSHRQTDVIFSFWCCRCGWPNSPTALVSRYRLWRGGGGGGVRQKENIFLDKNFAVIKSQFFSLPSLKPNKKQIPPEPRSCSKKRSARRQNGIAQQSWKEQQILTQL